MRQPLLLLLLSIIFGVQGFAQDLNQISNIDKLYALTNYWKEVEYNFVYFNKVDKAEWTSSYRRLLDEVSELDDFEYYRRLQKLSALLNDGHTQIYPPDHLENMIVHGEFDDFKLATALVEGKVVIARVSQNKKDIFPIGTEIVKINGRPVTQYMNEEIEPYLSVSSPHVKKIKAAERVFSSIKGTSYHIQFKTPTGRVIASDLKLSPTQNNKMYPILPEGSAFSSRWLRNKIFYVKLQSFEKSSIYNEFLKILPEMKKAKGIILDIRNNGGGSSAVARNIAQHFISDSLIYGAKNQSRLLIPTDRALGSFLSAQDTLEGKKDWGLSREQTLMYYKSAQGYLFHDYPSSPIRIGREVEKIIVPTLILTESNTASAAEDFLIYTDRQSHIRRMGNYTYGSTGQPLTLALPNGGEAWICTKKVSFPDGTEFVGTGIRPHIKVDYTLKDLIKDEDSVLDRAMRELAKATN